MNNRIVNSLWIGKTLGPIQHASIRSYLENDHEFHLYTYNELSDTPEDVVIKDANEILPSNQIFFDHKSSYQTFISWFKLVLLYKVGGWWVDSDTLCLKYLDFPQRFVFATMQCDAVFPVEFRDTFLKMPMKSELGLALLKDIARKLRVGDKSRLGNNLVLKRISQNYLANFIVAPQIFPCHCDGHPSAGTRNRSAQLSYGLQLNKQYM
jgi:hypothetical protein